MEQKSQMSNNDIQHLVKYWETDSLTKMLTIK